MQGLACTGEGRCPRHRADRERGAGLQRRRPSPLESRRRSHDKL